MNKHVVGYQKNSGKEITRVKRRCVICGKTYKSHSNENKRKYCSDKCLEKANSVVYCKKCSAKIGLLRDVGPYPKTCEECLRENRLSRSRYYEDTAYAPDEIEFGNYKEPLSAFKGGKVGKKNFREGYGYKGVLMYSKERDRVQCHLCGLMFRSITESHTLHIHGITIKEYRKLTGLADTTRLIGEGTREKLIKNYNIRPMVPIKDRPEDFKISKKTLVASNKRRAGTKIRMETKNKRGSCPEQLLAKIRDLREELGRTPSRRDFQMKHKGRFMGTIYATFGSWRNAVKKAGYKPVSQVKKEKYSDERLLEYMQEFYDIHKRSPRSSDFRRGLLPDTKVYIKRFGSLNNARIEAGVPVLVPLGSFGRVVEVNPEEYLAR